ncbi:MAG TPA: mycothiol synthase [Acidimicrobiales bacterium]|nr:mycothiol synthase [Acidimicrobiales bacterium]
MNRYPRKVHLVEIKRRMGEEDIAAVARLLRAAERVDDHAPLGEHKWLDLVQGGRAGFAGFVAREQGHERVIGYAQVARGENSWSIEFVVHPSIRHSDSHVAIALLKSALDEIARDGGGHVHLWVPKPTSRHDEIAAALGMTRGRELYQMRRPLSLSSPSFDDYAPTRPFIVGSDEDAWLALNRKAFANHPEQGAWDIETLRDRELQPWFDPEGFLLHEGVDGIDGFCWTKVHDEGDEPIGEVYVIGVHPDVRGQGLGRGLLASGLRSLAARGIHTAMLYVDAQNTTAVALYNSAGFIIDHIDLAYVINISPPAP